MPTLALVALLGCAGGDDGGDDGKPPMCAPFDVDGCTPQYPAQFERIMTETMQPVCGVQGGACHGAVDAAGAGGGLHIESDLDATHATLLGADGGPAFVVPGDAMCSPVTTRINLPDDDPSLMPPGAIPLEEGVRCAIAQWVAAGAER